VELWTRLVLVAFYIQVGLWVGLGLSLPPTQTRKGHKGTLSSCAASEGTIVLAVTESGGVRILIFVGGWWLKSR
jgi:hypothetical protein